MVKALLRQMKDNEEKARLLAEAEARDKILFCEMNSTDVEVTADSGDSPVEGDKVLELTEMNVHVTDAESRKVSSIKLEHINVERVWALYLAKFKKSFKFTSPAEVFNNLKARKKLLEVIFF
jgi:acetyl/propionyl-CoA carboxylase alpha subunit